MIPTEKLSTFNLRFIFISAWLYGSSVAELSYPIDSVTLCSPTSYLKSMNMFDMLTANAATALYLTGPTVSCMPF